MLNHAAKRRVRVDFLQPSRLNRVQEVSRISTSFRETVRKAVFGTHVRKVSNSSRARFLPQHLNHVNCFLLFRRVRGRSSGYKIVRIGANVNFGIQSAYILPQTPEHLTGSKTPHQSVQFSDSSTKGRSFDFSGFEEDQRASGVSSILDPFIDNKNRHRPLGRLVAVVPKGCIGNA